MRSEVARILAGERVEESVRLTPGPEGTLQYSLSIGSSVAGNASVHYTAGSITVLLSEQAVKLWAPDDQVGIYTTIDTGPTTSLELSIEKDFACLDRDEQENQDTFENPHTKHEC
jgi:hypothetical protein